MDYTVRIFPFYLWNDVWVSSYCPTGVPVFAVLCVRQYSTHDKFRYISFICFKFHANLRFFFLLPIITIFLARIGILTTKFLWSQQKTVIIGLAVITAILTPTIDALSMILLFLPLLIIYEFSVLLVRIIEKRRLKTKP